MRSLIIVLICLFSVFTAHAQNSDYELAKNFLEKKDYEKAVENYSKYLKNENDYRGYMGRAQAYIGLKKYHNAIKDYSSAIDLEKEDSRIYYNRGNCFLEMGEEQAAYADFVEAIKLDPANYHAYNSRGYLYFSKDSLEKAEEDFLRAISLNLNFRLAYFNLADLYIKRQDLEIAIELIAEYIQYNKQDYRAYTYLGRLYLKMGNIELASKFLGTSLSIELNQPKVIEEVGEILVYFLKDYPSAIAFFGKASEEYESSETKYLAGISEFSLGNYQKALDQFLLVRILAKDTIYTEVELLIVSCLDELGRDQEVIELLDSLEKAKIFPAKVALQKSLYFMDQEDYKSSLKYLENSISKDPNIKSYIQKAYLLSKMGKLNQSIELYEELDSSKTYRKEIFESMAQVYFQNKDEKKACNCIYNSVLEGSRNNLLGMIKNCGAQLDSNQNRVLKILDIMQVYQKKGMTYRDQRDFDFLVSQAPEVFDFRLWRGIHFKSNGKYSKAIKDFSKCIELKPSSFEGYYFAGNSMLGAKDTTTYLTTMTIGIHKTKAIELYYSRALFYLSIEDYEFAFKDLKELLSLYPSYSNAYYQLGELFTKTKEQEKACKYYKQALLLGHDKARLEFKVSCQ